jgi:hypothetical protein
MYIQNSITPVSPAFLRSDSSQFNQNKETFHDIFQRTLNNKSGSRPPKIELTGVLTPLGRSGLASCRYKLETDSKEYLLGLSDPLKRTARKLEWEEVTVRGYLDFDSDVFEVEKMSLTGNHDPFETTVRLPVNHFDLEGLKKAISQKGKLDLAPEYLAS